MKHRGVGLRRSCEQLNKNMKITSGEYEVIFSGTVIGIDEEPIEFQFPDTHASLKIVIDFKDDPSTQGSPIKFDFPEDNALKITMINSKSSMGSGNTKLLEIGFLGSRLLYLNYRVYSINDISKTIHYTFYLGKEGSYVKQ